MSTSTGLLSWKKQIQQLQQKNLLALLQVGVKSKKEKNMSKLILVGLVALGLVGCGAKEEVAVEAAPAAEVAAEAPAAEAPAADAAVEAAPADAAVETPAAQ